MVAYNVHNFQTGQIIEAAPINEMDNQIKKNSEDIQDINDRRGVANGFASLNAQGQVPASQIQIKFTDDNAGNVSVDFGV